MISREEAYEELADFWWGDIVIDRIYDSIGSCGECKHYALSTLTPKGEKKAPDMCRLTLTGQPPNHFCADFEREEDD